MTQHGANRDGRPPSGGSMGGDAAASGDACTLDLGMVGHHGDLHAFRLRVCDSELTRLLECARRARRLYELFLLARPGDLLDYLSIVPLETPPPLAKRIDALRGRLGAREGPLKYSDFAGLFQWMDWDMEPEDRAWFLKGRPLLNRTILAPAFDRVVAAQESVREGDILQRHVSGRIREGRDERRFETRLQCRTDGMENPDSSPRHGVAFHQLLATVLADTALASIAYRGKADEAVLHALATEQRRRAQLTGHRPAVALWIGVLGSGYVDNQEWDSEITYFDEGLSHGDLFIEEQPGSNLPQLVAQHGRVPGRYILSPHDQGEIAGFTRMQREGGWLYQRHDPLPWRAAFTRIATERLRQRAPVLLDLGEDDACLFTHEKMLVVLGSAPSPALRELLLDLLRTRSAFGPTWICGNTDALRAADVHNLILLDRVDAAAPDPPAAHAGPDDLPTPWPSHVDCILALGADARRIADVVARVPAPLRPPDVFAEVAVPGLQSTALLKGDPLTVLRAARDRALRHPPRRK